MVGVVGLVAPRGAVAAGGRGRITLRRRCRRLLLRLGDAGVHPRRLRGLARAERRGVGAVPRAEAEEGEQCRGREDKDGSLEWKVH